MALPCQFAAQVGHYEGTSFRDKFVTNRRRRRGDKVLNWTRSLLSPPAARLFMNPRVVRCPYCVLGVQFRPMVPHLGEWFMCEKCGHLSLGDGTSFNCSCQRCGELNSSRIHRDVNPILKIKTVAS